MWNLNSWHLLISCPAYSWDVGHASCAPSRFPWGVNRVAAGIAGPGRCCTCVRVWPRYHTLLLGTASEWSVSASGCGIAFSRKGKKTHSLRQREQGGRGESPAAAGAKRGCFLPCFLSALCWNLLCSF